MANCTTFDLLLVDWLYDELEPAEAARFTRHIEGCEVCWHTAEAMTRIRALARELPDEPPPDAVSGRILHVAAQQAASTRKRGLWAWLAGSFELAWAHPAAAALATMVLVAGVAGALFARGQLEMATPNTSEGEGTRLGAVSTPADSDHAATGNELAVTASPSAPAPAVVPSSEKRAAGLVEVDTMAEAGAEAEEQSGRASGTRGKLRRDGAAAEPQAGKRLEATPEQPAPARPRPAAAAPMDLYVGDESDPLEQWQAGPRDDARDRAAEGAILGAGRTAGPLAGTEASAPAGASGATPDGVPGHASGDAAEASPEATSTTAFNTKPEDKNERAQPRRAARQRGATTGAEAMHDELRAALRRQECARAVRIAEDIRARDPGYYRLRLADGKELAACRQPAEAQGQAGKKSAN